MANIADEILAELKAIRAALEGGAAPKAGAVPKAAAKPAAAKGPTLEQVQDKIRELAGADDANKAKIKAAIEKLGGKRAGDFEADAAKLTKLMTALEAIEGEEPASGDEDDDLL